MNYIFSFFTAISVPGKAPGGVYSDLHNAGIIGDILYRFNDVLTRWVAYDYWTYEGQFTVTPDQLNCDVINLVLHGVDTVAYVELNDHPIGSTDNMFVRYVFDIKKLLLVRTVSYVIAFISVSAVTSRHHTMHNIRYEEESYRYLIYYLFLRNGLAWLSISQN